MPLYAIFIFVRDLMDTNDTMKVCENVLKIKCQLCNDSEDLLLVITFIFFETKPRPSGRPVQLDNDASKSLVASDPSLIVQELSWGLG